MIVLLFRCPFSPAPPFLPLCPSPTAHAKLPCMTTPSMTLPQRLRDWSKLTWPIAAATVLYGVSQAFLYVMLSRAGGGKALTLQTTLSNETFHRIAAELIADGRIAVYYRHFYLDYLHPFWYAALLSLLLARLFVANGVSSRSDWLLLAPWFAAACDLFENTMHLYFLANLERATPLLVAISGTATNIKWAITGACTVAIALLLGHWVLVARGRLN